MNELYAYYLKTYRLKHNDFGVHNVRTTRRFVQILHCWASESTHTS